MSEADDQVKPLAPDVHRLHINDVDQQLAATTSTDFMPRSNHHQCCIKCCGCFAAVFLVTATAILVLMFTVFRIKDPVLKMNYAAVQGLDLITSNNSNTQHGTNPLVFNLTFETNMSIKNPNAASFQFNNATTLVYYNGSLVGESRSLSGEARPRTTVGLNVTVDLTVGSARLKRDLDRGVLSISSHTKVSGKVKIGDVIKRRLVVRMNCMMDVNVSSHGIQDMNCS